MTLLGHPKILMMVEKPLGRIFFVPPKCSVFKTPGNDREVSIHAEADPHDLQLAPLIFNVDFYLDDSIEENGYLWLAPGSHTDAHQQAKERIFRRLDFSGMVPVPMRAGDVLFHDARLIHGSPRSNGGALRRTLYYEFQSIAAMQKQGGPRPGFLHNEAFVRVRIRLLMREIQQRAQNSFAENETSFEYCPPEDWNVAPPDTDE